MNMFTNYNLTPESYIPNNLHEDNRIPPKPRYPLVAYNKLGEAIGFTWNYGDTVYLEFTTTGNVEFDEGVVEDAETYLTGKKFELQLYDFRYNVVAYCDCDAGAQVKILSDSFYPHSLVPGTYHLKLEVVDKGADTRFTLLDNDDCIIYIK